MFPMKSSAAFLGIFLCLSMLQDIFLDKIIEWKSSVDTMAPYVGGPTLRKRLIDSWSTLLAVFPIFNSGFFFQEHNLGNFQAYGE